MQTNTSRRLPAPKLFLLAGLTLLAIGAGLFLGALAIHDLAWSQTGRLLRSLGPVPLFLAVGLTVAAGYLRGIRWKLLLHPEPISAFRLYLIEQTGTAMDTMSAVHLLDEVVETAILTRHDHISMGKVLATLAMQRTLEFGATVLILGALALVIEPLREIRPYMAGAVAGAVLALALLYTVGPNLIRLPVLRRLSFVRRFAESIRMLRSDWKRTGTAFGISVAQSLMIGISGWLIADSLGVTLNLLDATAITMGVMLFGSTVPGMPLAVGTYEFAAVSLFSLWDRPSSEAVSFTILLRINVYLIPIIMAAFFLSREGIVSLGRIVALFRDATPESRQITPENS